MFHNPELDSKLQQARKECEDASIKMSEAANKIVETKSRKKAQVQVKVDQNKLT